MSKKGLMVLVLLLSVAAAGILVSCAGNGSGAGGVAVTFTFMDRLTGDPVSGVSMHVNGEQKSSDAQGQIGLSTDSSSMRLEMYVNPVTLLGLGFFIDGPGVYWYFAFTAETSFTRTIILEPLPDSPVGYAIDGSVYKNLTI